LCIGSPNGGAGAVRGDGEFVGISNISNIYIKKYVYQISFDE